MSWRPSEPEPTWHVTQPGAGYPWATRGSWYNRAGGGQFHGRLTAPLPRQGLGRVEGRRPALPALQRLAPGGGERRREPATRHAGDRDRPPAAAVLRDQGRREAHRLRGRGGRRRPVDAHRLGQGH